ncbi:MAG: hypothetical protein P8X79_23185 [Reinekea sp.]
MKAARLGNAGTGAVVAVFFATNVTGPERAGRNIIASIVTWLYRPPLMTERALALRFCLQSM